MNRRHTRQVVAVDIHALRNATGKFLLRHLWTFFCCIDRDSANAGSGRASAAFVAAVAVFALGGEADAQSVAPERKTLPEHARFCPSWAEAHERTLASLNNGRPPYAVRWRGCILLKKGVQVGVVGSDDAATEIVYRGKHWFADDPLFSARR